MALWASEWLAVEEQPVNLVRELREVLQITQALPQAQAISEDDITAEITVWRQNAGSTISHGVGATARTTKTAAPQAAKKA